MRNYIVMSFDDKAKAYEGLHALWLLDGEGQVTVHGTTVVHRNLWGDFHVDTKETHPALATAAGVGIGALLGLLAGPAGVAVGAAAGAAIGAAVGGVVGVSTDLARAETRDQAQHEAAFLLRAGQSAVIADVSEISPGPLESMVRALGGTLRRRDWGTLRQDAWFNDYPPANYLYPYEYVPSTYAL